MSRARLQDLSAELALEVFMPLEHQDGCAPLGQEQAEHEAPRPSTHDARAHANAGRHSCPRYSRTELIATAPSATAAVTPRGERCRTSAPAGELASLLEDAERARGARHEEPVAARDQALDVFPVRVRVAARDVVVLADLENAVDGFGHHGVLVLPGGSELLAQVPFPDQHDADAADLLEDPREILDRLRVLALDDRQDLALRGERPHVGPGVILLLRESPVPRRPRRGVAADAGRVVEGSPRQAWVPAGADRVAGLRHGADVREDDAEQAH